MKAMVLKGISSLADNKTPLVLEDLPIPTPREGELLVRMSACGVCHTELDEIEGRTPPPRFPVVPGHQVVGTVEAMGINTKGFQIGQRIGIAWIHSSCGKCKFCLSGNENLCPDFKATGRDVNGGYAEYMTVPAEFAYNIPAAFSDVEAAPLLCAGAIGYRSLKLARHDDGQNLGLMGFGASAHLVLKMVRHRYPNSNVYAFSRSQEERQFSKELGALWAGGIEEDPPEELDSIIDTTPVWKPVVEALKNLAPGGRLVINAIRKEDLDKEYLLQVDYSKHMWLEKEIKSVANVTRSDVQEFLDLAAIIPIKPVVEEYRLPEANNALVELREKQVRGAKVLRVD